MIINCFFECPKCFEENEVSYDLFEHFCDLQDNCDCCQHKFTDEEKDKIYSSLEGDAMGSAIDRAEMYSDR